MHFLILLAILFITAPATAAEPAKPAPAEKPPQKKAAKPVKPPAADQAAGEEELAPSPDIDEGAALPPYPPGTRTAMGAPQVYELGEEDTLLDVTRHFRLGFIEARAANPAIDPWMPTPGAEVTIPSFKLLPRAEQKGIVVNLAQMRLYYFGGSAPVTFPIGVGREGLQTPTGKTTVIKKIESPTWFPTARMREEKKWLPAAVPPGPANPLGTHALYLGWESILIHGSNKPWAIGRRVSSGCMRMYPEDIAELFRLAPVGTRVTVVDQPILVARVGETVYLEANPSKSQGNDIEITGEHAVKRLDDKLRKVILDAAGVDENEIDWKTVERTVEERSGIPVAIAGKTEARASKKIKPQMAPVYNP